MKLYSLFVMLAFLFNNSVFANESDIECFVSRVIEAVTTKNSKEFELLFESTKLIPTDNEYDYYFGVKGHDSELVTFLRNDDIRYVVFDIENDLNVIVFYRESLAQKPKNINWSVIGGEWLKTFAVLEVKLTNNIWHFHETPFFYFRHAPWVDDYG